MWVEYVFIYIFPGNVQEALDAEPRMSLGEPSGVVSLP